jgi:hypothetical protein
MPGARRRDRPGPTGPPVRRRRAAVPVLALVLAAHLAAAPPAGAGAPLRPLGTVTLGRPVTGAGCPADHTCRNVTVTCPGVQRPLGATIAVAQPAGTSPSGARTPAATPWPAARPP